MSTNAEHREQLERELGAVGIRADIGRTEGGHMRVRWSHRGKLRAILTSWTPSDHRSTLNARSRIRQILREDGVFDQPREERPKPLQKALTVPIGRDPTCVRIERLEQDIVALLDIVAELTTKLSVKFDDEPVAVVSAADHAPAKRKSHPGNKRHDLLFCMEYTAVPVATLVQRSGRTPGAISVALTNLKADGLVENPVRGMWRKVAPQIGANGAHVANGVNGHHA